MRPDLSPGRRARLVGKDCAAHRFAVSAYPLPRRLPDAQGPPAGHARTRRTACVALRGRVASQVRRARGPQNELNEATEIPDRLRGPTDGDLVYVERCAVCAGREFLRHHYDAPYEYLRCANCRLVHTSPRLRDDATIRVYNHEYWQNPEPRNCGYADYRNDESRYIKTFKRRLAAIEGLIPDRGTALDIGCATGFFLKVLSDMGWEVHGIEPSVAIAEWAYRRFGIENIHAGTLDSAPLENSTFDLVTLWDVIEHVPDPKGLLRALHRHVASDGLLVIETQNVDSLAARLLGRRWHHFKHLEHLYHFNPHSIRFLLETSGFEVIYLSSRNAGKYVTFGFARERVRRYSRLASGFLDLLSSLDESQFYVNPHDEMIVIARRSTPSNDAD
ncbi:MAG: class I SAM-dependent methyltransferase [Proteobacteria bacterium]|nr:MAG: class I SAM-dependent methyltransferase [Pseudomonadota bacterium]